MKKIGTKVGAPIEKSAKCAVVEEEGVKSFTIGKGVTLVSRMKVASAGGKMMGSSCGGNRNINSIKARTICPVCKQNRNWWKYRENAAKI